METMNLKQVSQVLKISEATARNRLSLGLPMPPSFKIGRHRLFLTLAFKQWIQEQANLQKTGVSIVALRKNQEQEKQNGLI
jgi:K+/H+ antiporter YhaU regulatory subunit KhtT